MVLTRLTWDLLTFWCISVPFKIYAYRCKAGAVTKLGHKGDSGVLVMFYFLVRVAVNGVCSLGKIH